MSIFSSFANKLNKINSRFNKVVRVANRAYNIERQVKSIASDTKNVIKNPDPEKPSARMPPPRRPTYK
jgi:hypothetical protein